MNQSPLSVLLFAYLLCSIRNVDASGRTISDYRVRDHDLTPVLGRGFSIATGTLQSSCLEVVQRTKPSYDYDFYFTEVKGSDSKERENNMSTRFKSSLSYRCVSSEIERSTSEKSDSKTKKTKHFMLATMRSERYYDSVDEIDAQLSPDSRALLEKGQFISFFQACGPNYIRSIRRAQEVTVIIEYESAEKDTEFEKELKIRINRGGYLPTSSSSSRLQNSKLESNAKFDSLKIYIKAFGLGLNEDDSGSLIATSIDDLTNVLEFAFKSMQTPGIGMVQGIEIVSWVDNPQFQIAAGLSDAVNNCVEDKYPLKPLNGGEEKDGVAKKCNVVSTELRKMHLAANGEYVATMNRVMRNKIDTLNNLQQCRSVLHQWPTCYANEKLVIPYTDANFIDNYSETSSDMTVGQLKDHVNAKNLIKLSKDATNYVEHFYAPCIEALTAEYDGVEGGTAMVKSWFSIDECKDVLCTVQGVSIANGLCAIEEPDVASVMSGLYCMPVLEKSFKV